jgi:hypothetical protein
MLVQDVMQTKLVTVAPDTTLPWRSPASSVTGG